MSLLTGESRSATVEAATDCVVFEITKDDLDELLSVRPEIAEQLTQILAERRTLNLKARSDQSVGDPEVEHATFANQLLIRMRGFFSSLTKRST